MFEGPNFFPLQQPLSYLLHGQAHNSAPLPLDFRDEERPQALYGVGTGLVVAFAGGGVGAQDVFRPCGESDFGGVAKEVCALRGVPVQPDEAAARIDRMGAALQVEEHGERLFPAFGLAEDDGALLLVEDDDGVGPEDYGVRHFRGEGAGRGFGFGPGGAHGVGGGIVVEARGGFRAFHHPDGEIHAEARQ